MLDCKPLLLGLAIAGLSLPAMAARGMSATASHARLVEANFYRMMSVVDPLTLAQPPAPSSLLDLFDNNTAVPAPFRSVPRGTKVTGATLATEGDEVKVCLKTAPLPKDDWIPLLQEVSKLGWGWAADDQCTTTHLSAAPTSFPASMHFYKSFNAKQVPLATTISEFPEFKLPAGARLNAKTLPALVLKGGEFAAEGAHKASIVVKNTNPAPDPLLLGDPGTEPLYRELWDKATTRLQLLEIDAPFAVVHSCAAIGPQEQCTMELSFNTEGLRAGAVIPGSVRIQFDSHTSRIGVEGRVCSSKLKT